MLIEFENTTFGSFHYSNLRVCTLIQLSTVYGPSGPDLSSISRRIQDGEAGQLTASTRTLGGKLNEGAHVEVAHEVALEMESPNRRVFKFN